MHTRILNFIIIHAYNTNHFFALIRPIPRAANYLLADP